MKVLIIEDNDYKLEDAIQTLQSFGITDYVHVNNYIEAVHICFRQKRLSEFDFIILDIQFYEYRVLKGDRALPDQYAGYKFLFKLAEIKASIPVFVFSSASTDLITTRSANGLMVIINNLLNEVRFNLFIGQISVIHTEASISLFI